MNIPSFIEQHFKKVNFLFPSQNCFQISFKPQCFNKFSKLCQIFNSFYLNFRKSFRFSPSGIQRYTQYHGPAYYTKPDFNDFKSVVEFDSAGSYTSTSDKKAPKPKPFSVMLDIYPITEIEQNGVSQSRPRPQVNFLPTKVVPRRNRKHYPSPPLLPVASDTRPFFSDPPDEEDKQQMILHLNLYPRKKPRFARWAIFRVFPRDF